MSKRMTAVLIAAFLVTLVYAFLSGERGTPSSDIRMPSPEIGTDSTPQAGYRPDDSATGDVTGSSDKPGQVGKVVVGQPVNPTIDRWGVPATSSFPVQPNARQPDADFSANDRSLDHGSSGSTGAIARPGQLAGPDASVTESFGSPPEASDPGVMGPAPEASDTGVIGLAPEAGELSFEYGAPEVGESGDPGLPPEASDPGTMGPAPEDTGRVDP